MSAALRIGGMAFAALAFLIVSPCGATERTPAPTLGTCGTSTGAFLFPGTDACLTIGGFVRAEGGLVLASPVVGPVSLGAAAVRPSPGPDLTRPALDASARLTADMRVPTEFGPLRVFVSLRGRNGAATGRPAR